jgi:hypothetical protein
LSKAVERRMTLRDQVTPAMRKINNGTLAYKKSVKDLEKTSNKTWERIKSGIGVVGVAMAGLSFTALANGMLKSASDAEEMQSKFNTVFGGLSSDAEAWAKDWKNKIGGSRNEIKGMLADSQDLLTGFGATKADAFLLSTQFQTLGSDLASFSNIQGGATEAVDRLRKGLMGEHENLKALGIIINETILAQRLASEGDKRKLKDLTELEKIQLRYRIAVSQSTNAIGDAERTSGSYANQVRNFQGTLKDASAELGKRFLPIATQGISSLTNLIVSSTDAALGLYTVISSNWSNISPIVYGVVGSLVAYKVAIIASNLYTVAKTKSLQLAAWWTTFYGNANSGAAKKVGILTLAQRGLNAAMRANPIGFVITSLGLLVTAGLYVIKNWEQVKLVGMNTWNTVVDVAEYGVNSYIKYANIMLRAYKFAFDSIEFAGKSIWNGIISTAENEVKNLLKPLNSIRKQMGMSAITADFSSAKVIAEKPKWDSSLNLIPTVSFDRGKFSDDSIMSQTKKAQEERDKKGQKEQKATENWTNALNANTSALIETKGGGNTFNTTIQQAQMTAEEIADKLFGRIERHLYKT